MLRDGKGTRREPPRSVARRAQQGLSGRSVRGREAVTRVWRSARAARRSATAQRSPSGRTTVTRPGSSGCASSPTPTSTPRPPRHWDAERYYTDPSYYNVEGPGAPLSRRHVVRLLPRGSEPGESARRRRASGTSPISAPRSARSTCGSTACSSSTATSPRDKRTSCTSSCSTYRPGSMDTSLVSTDNINNPRTMNAVYDFVSRMGLAKRLWHEKLAGGELNNKQFNDFPQTGRVQGVLRSGERHSAHAARTQGRLRLGRPAGGPQPRLSQHRAVQRGVAAALQPGRRRQADHADRDRGRAEELGLLAGDRGRHTGYGTVLPQGGPARPSRRMRPGRTVSERGCTPRSSAASRCSPTPARAATRARRSSHHRISI